MNNSYNILFIFLRIYYYFYVQDVSNNLKELGISHHNEVEVDYGYVVDILIGKLTSSPTTASSTTTTTTLNNNNNAATLNNNNDNYNVKSKPVVLEINGPFHYDTYINRTLGPTVMKKRHLELLGYEVVTLPYWKYSLRDTKEHKHKILKEYLNL